MGLNKPENTFDFKRITENDIVTDPGFSQGAAWADYDNDGDLDIFIANGGNNPNLLYRNPGNSNYWLKIKCIGTLSNRSAIGARIFLYQKDKLQTREIAGQTGGGYGAQNSLLLHFGLGKRKKIDTLAVRWPSEKYMSIKKPHCNQLLTIVDK